MDEVRGSEEAERLLAAYRKHDAAVAAKALREAADVLNAEESSGWAILALLRDRADAIEREAGESGADT